MLHPTFDVVQYVSDDCRKFKSHIGVHVFLIFRNRP